MPEEELVSEQEYSSSSEVQAMEAEILDHLDFMIKIVEAEEAISDEF